MKESKIRENFAIKLTIIAVVFPVMFIACSVLFKIPLALLFGYLFSKNNMVIWTVNIIGTAAGLAGATWISRMAWPKNRETENENNC